MTTLTLADEIVVLMLDDATGEVNTDCLSVASVAIAGGVLMELALRGNIDTDLQSLFVVNPEPTGDEMLDEVLQEIVEEPERHSSSWWIDRLSRLHAGLVERVLARLVASGILREEKHRFLWVFSRRAYPQVSDREEREAKGRLMAVLFNDEVPAPRDTLLLALANATGVLYAILSNEQREKCAPRVREVVALEEIGRSVAVVTDYVRDAVTLMLVGYH